MAKRARQEKEIDENKNVYEAALERIDQIYDQFDTVAVAFSGGKDSTAVLNCALKVARDRKRLPLKVLYYDEEIVHPPTVEYVERIYRNDEVDLDWLCLEVKHRNACSNEEPFWYPWDKDKKDVWLRDMPEWGTSSHERFHKGMTIPDFAPHYFDRSKGSACLMLGIRTTESIRRHRVIMTKKNDCFISKMSSASKELIKENRKTFAFNGFPIYDWSTKDVWVAVNKFNWDYNRTYDALNKTRLFEKHHHQRCSPAFGEEPLRTLWLWNECWPEYWHRMIERVPGVGTAWRYANTELYSNANQKPDDISFREYSLILIDQYDGVPKELVKKGVTTYINMHKSKTKQPIEDEIAHPVSGISWKMICQVIQRGDFKQRQKNAIQQASLKRCKELGITYDQAMRIYK